MNDKLRALVEQIAEVESFVSEWDEWFGNYVTFTTKRDLIRKFGSSEDIKEYISQLDDRAREALDIANGAEKEIIQKFNLDVEGARIMVTQLRTIMHQILTAVSEETQDDILDLNKEELVEAAFDLLKGSHSDSNS